MIISAEELFERFREEHPEFSHIPTPELLSACHSQFEQVKKTMEGPVLSEVRLKYLFTVRVYKYRIVRQLRSTFNGLEKGYIKRENFNRYVILMLDYVRKNPDKFKKYEREIREITGFTGAQIQAGEYVNNPGKYHHC